ncbi:hypothetical protein [Sinosporangium album]|uniref:hypothetical protein n=1 Tax=Sinosporangium album TaxID=504805 RepID=UPI001C409D0C|nr:hypothetical protein [Sinosporangium album]
MTVNGSPPWPSGQVPIRNLFEVAGHLTPGKVHQLTGKRVRVETSPNDVFTEMSILD